jgi:actin related protein 2/3 complex subunit 1A/1B
LKTWEKDLTLVANEKAVVDGSWSPNGQKFVVGTSCHRVFVGYYEDKQKWWQSAKISNNKSTVLSVRWHPSGRVIGVGSSDFTFMLVTAVIQDTEYVTDPLEDSSYSGTYASINSFCEGTQSHRIPVLFSLKNTFGWVESLSFSPNGARVVFAVHNGLVQLLDLSDDNVEFQGEGRVPTFNQTTRLCTHLRCLSRRSNL